MKTKVVAKTRADKRYSAKFPILNFRAPKGTKKIIRDYSRRIGVSQGELVRRFVAALPKGNSRRREVRVDVGP